VVPLARHPRIDNRVIVFDLEQDPETLLRLSPEEIADRLYTPAADLPEGESRIALKEIHLNKCPVLVAWDHLRASDFERLHIDPSQAQARAALLRDAGPALAEKVRQVFANERDRTPPDVDASLYDGFMGDGDKRIFAEVRATPPLALGAKTFGFRDPRLPELLFRYRARNWPETLSASERARWDDYRRLRLCEQRGLSEYSFDTFRAEIVSLRLAHAGDGSRQALLDRLEAWGQELEATLA